MTDALIHITGIVQGVGMRPFVFREAVANRISGWVLNAGDGVHIEAHGADEDMRKFVRALSAHAPAASRVERVAVTPLENHPSRDGGAASAPDAPAFIIRASEDETAHTTLVSPDIATCPDCVRELFDPADRRYHYPFINCTNCGPRFTIIRDLPYDRAMTSMDRFPMCPACAAEYANPLDRRFHAQPDACFECGPHITWRERDPQPGTAPDASPVPAIGRTRQESDAIIERCRELIAAGGIVAIKGLGGFHLACDASNQAAVLELRRRKRRSNKPLAVMVRDLDRARAVCHVDEDEQQLLAGSVRPIVLLRRRKPAPGARPATAPAVALAVAFDLPELGVMLPYTPLQHLLLASCEKTGVTALVMTSGNVSEEPIETNDELAWERLVATGIADALLGNDRDILSRYDDSVVRVIDGAAMPVRRARGYAPQPLPLPVRPLPPATQNVPIAQDACILACGSEQKATLALTRENADGTASCFLSQHIGDIENAETLDAWHAARERLTGLFDLRQTAIACDLHPTYLSSQWARQQAAQHQAPLIEVQHHHAHIAAVMAEHSRRDRVLGLAFDGTGAGTDGTVWGGELLLCDLGGYARAGSLAPWRLPGAAASVRDARRNALSLLYAADLLDHPGAAAALGQLNPTMREVTLQMVERGINSPLTSSMGRLLDAVSALLGICGVATYEGEPAILLEAAAWRARDRNAPAIDLPSFALSCQSPAEPDSQTRSHMARVDEEPPQRRLTLDPAPALQGVLDGLHTGAPTDALALAFHQSVARSACAAAEDICRDAGVRTVALSGGVFMNRLLLQLIRNGLESAGLEVLIPRSVPVNDGCIAYGQAAVARQRLSLG
ncbi:MAG: carbamoyltransferase HypF [Collinsella tanakaei]|nr:MAG: carbamoyltransferase HypF [Collinsella tanakaei]